MKNCDFQIKLGGGGWHIAMELTVAVTSIRRKANVQPASDEQLEK